MSARRDQQAASFGAAAAAYDRGRPSYPDAAVRWCLPENARRVLDLGAGTGKLTRVLAGLVDDVVAVEPLPGMREQFAAGLAEVPILDGTAERIPLPDRSVDAVFCGQAWHWVDPARACPEVARVLRPGGVLALLWNVRQRGSGWTAALDDLLARTDAVGATDDPVVVEPPLIGPDRRDVEWNQQLTTDGLVDMLASRSYYITMVPAEQAAFRRALDDEVIRLIPDPEAVELPYRTQCWRYHLPTAPE